MLDLSKDSFKRPEQLRDHEDPAVLYALSLLLTRAVIGVVGILLPIILIVGEAFFLEGDVTVRGSISAYYHTGMRDVFVASLCVIGFFMLTYMAGQRRTWDFWLSLVAGIAVIGVAFLPTSRPGLTESAPRCESADRLLEGCTAVQQKFGETLVASIHFVCAAVFILSLAALCFVFADREKVYRRNLGMAMTLRALGGVILAAVAWIAIGGVLGATIWNITPLYLGEIVAVWAFGAAWLIKARDLLLRVGKRGGVVDAA